MVHLSFKHYSIIIAYLLQVISLLFFKNTLKSQHINVARETDLVLRSLFSEQSLKVQSHQHTKTCFVPPHLSESPHSALCILYFASEYYKMCKADFKVRKIPNCLLAVVVVPPWKMFLWLLYISPSSISVSILSCSNNMFLLLLLCNRSLSPPRAAWFQHGHFCHYDIRVCVCVCFCVSLYTTECASLCICCVESKWLLWRLREQL